MKMTDVTGWHYRIVSNDGYVMTSSKERQGFTGYNTPAMATNVARSVERDYPNGSTYIQLSDTPGVWTNILPVTEVQCKLPLQLAI